MVGDKELDTGFRCWSCKEFTTLRARIAELEQDLAYFPSTVRSLAETVTDRDAEINQLRAELAAIKAQDPVQVDYVAVMRADGDGGLEVEWLLEGGTAELMNGMYLCCVGSGTLLFEEGSGHLYAAPVSEAKAQGVVMPERLKPSRYELHDAAVDAWNSCLDEVARLNAAPVQQAEYGDAYQGAREDLAIWKRRALEAEEKVLQQEQIIDHLTSEAQGESRFGEPVVTPDAPCVPDGYVLADKKALGTVLQALVNAPHHIRELQVTRQPVELFSDNPINVLIANYEAPAAPAADAGLVEAFCKVEQALDLIGGIRHGKNVTQDELWQSCELLDAALAAHRAKGVV